VKCAHCGYGCSGHATWSKGKRYSYYLCIAKWPEKTPKAPPHKPRYVKAEWLEKTVWDDVRFFLENPGEVLERLREQMGDDDEAKKLERRQGDLRKRLAGKQAEKDHYVRLYAQEHISEDELSVYLADLKNQITYRFGPPSEAAGEENTEEMFVGSAQNALS
jgi:Recombinase zinc beta ribbon domain